MTKVRWLVRQIVHLGGPKVTGLFALTIPLGLIQGLTEIVFGFALLNFLRHFQLVAPEHMPLDAAFGHFNPVALVLGLGMLRSLVGSAAMAVNNTTYEAFNVMIRQRTASAVLKNPGTFRLSVAEASNILSNIAPRSCTFMSNFSTLVIQSVMIIIALAGLLRLSWPLSLVAIISVVVFGMPVLLLRKVFQGYTVLIHAGIKRFSDRLLKGIRNLEFLRIIDKTDDEAHVLVGISASVLRNYLRYIVTFSTATMWPQFGAVCVIVVVVVANMHYHWMPGIVLIPFVYLLSRLMAGASDIFRALGSMQFSWPHLRELAALFPENVATAPPAAWPASTDSRESSVQNLIVENLAIGRDNTVYLEGISFSGQLGDFICFHGESGRGKTTLLMTLIGLLPGKGGRILWNGKSLDTLMAGWFKGRVAYSGADPFLLDTTIRENVLLGNEHHHYNDHDIWNAFDIAKCTFAKDLAGQLDYSLREGGEGISAGQKQRLSIARALLRKPEVLLLDEATANIDVDTEAAIIEAIRTRYPKTLVLAVSHRESMMKFATRRIDF